MPYAISLVAVPALSPLAVSAVTVHWHTKLTGKERKEGKAAGVLQNRPETFTAPIIHSHCRSQCR